MQLHGHPRKRRKEKKEQERKWPPMGQSCCQSAHRRFEAEKLKKSQVLSSYRAAQALPEIPVIAQTAAAATCMRES